MVNRKGVREVRDVKGVRKEKKIERYKGEE